MASHVVTATWLFATEQIHTEQGGSPSTNARASPLYQTTSYPFNDSIHAANLCGLKELGNLYPRNINPTLAALQERIAGLEGAVERVDSDRLFPLEQQQRIAKLGPGARALRVIRSLHGQGIFLVKRDQLEGIVQEGVALAVRSQIGMGIRGKALLQGAAIGWKRFVLLLPNAPDQKRAVISV